MTETKLLPVVGRFGVPSAVTSRGILTRASLASPASVMEVDGHHITSQLS